MAHPLLQARMDRLRVSVRRNVGRASIPEWIVENTRHPLDPTKNWTFKDHEYQIEILKSEAEYTSVIKAAQTGMSETSIRLTLALASLYQSTNWMYILPSLIFARRFATTRFDPVIEHSPQLSRDISKDVDSSELKRLANSFIYFAGAQHARQSISVPAKGLVMDELDFCSQAVLTSFYSRLGHNKEGTSIVTRFSTPTLPGYGISKLHEEGSMGVYMVWHDACSQWVVVNPLTDIKLPGWEDETLVRFSKKDLDDPRLRIDDSFVECPHCKRRIALENLADPAKRAWVHHHPNRDKKSFYVSPLDVPVINTPPKILRGVENYARHADWVNFGLGIAYQDAENSVAIDAVERSAVVPSVFPSSGAAMGSVIGSDVGKISHMLVGRRNGNYLDIIWAERIKQDGEGNLVKTWKERMAQYGAWRTVVDAGPDITSPKQLIAESAYHQAWACYFTKGSKKALEDYTEDEATQIVSAARTRIIDETVKMLNSGEIRLLGNHPEMNTIKKHFKTMKRVDRISETTGEKIEHWTSTSTENHYFFSLVYLVIADSMVQDGVSAIPIPVSAMMRKVPVGANHRK